MPRTSMKYTLYATRVRKDQSRTQKMKQRAFLLGLIHIDIEVLLLRVRLHFPSAIIVPSAIIDSVMRLGVGLLHAAHGVYLCELGTGL